MNHEINDINFWKERLKNSGGVLHHSVYYGVVEKIDEEHKRAIIPHIQPGRTFIDLGCGYGRTSEWFPDNAYVGIDFSPDFIELAKKMYPDKKFYVMDILKGLPFKDKEFDYGIAIGMTGMFKRSGDWEVAEKQMKRVCKELINLDMYAADG